MIYQRQDAKISKANISIYDPIAKPVLLTFTLDFLPQINPLANPNDAIRMALIAVQGPGRPIIMSERRYDENPTTMPVVGPNITPLSMVKTPGKLMNCIEPNNACLANLIATAKPINIPV
jgi:hypothetical protein